MTKKNGVLCTASTGTVYAFVFRGCRLVVLETPSVSARVMRPGETQIIYANFQDFRQMGIWQMGDQGYFWLVNGKFK